MKESINKWQKAFSDIASNVSDDLLGEAKSKATTYRDVSTYIKRISQQAFGDITDPNDRAARTINGAICDLALYKLHEEERDLPIAKGLARNGGDRS